MEKFELSLWKDENSHKTNFSNLLAGLDQSAGRTLLDNREDIQKVKNYEELLSNNEYLLFIENEEGYKQWQIVYYIEKGVKDIILNFERSSNLVFGTNEYITEIKKYFEDNKLTSTVKQYFSELYTNNVINENDRFNYIFINQQGQEFKIQSLVDIYRIKNINTENKILVLANENINYFQGRIYNIHFIKNIDGTKKITFEVPKYYYDLFTNTKKINNYLELLGLKSKLKLHYKNQWYTFLINNRQEKKSKSGVFYSFEANDLFVEELSKTGYGLNFTEDVETIDLCGAGTAPELAERILKDSGWNFSQELTTANFQEYEEKTVYSPLEKKYINKRVPVLSYKKHYSPFLKQYVYETNLFAPVQDNNRFLSISDFNNYINFKDQDDFSVNEQNGWRIYCYDKSSIITTGSTPNLLASNSDFVSLDDWDTYNNNLKYSIIKQDDTYCLQLSAGGSIATRNFTKIPSKGNYLIKVNSITGKGEKYHIQINNNKKVLVEQSPELEEGKYYVFNLSSALGSQGNLIFSSDSGIVIKSIEFFNLEVQDKDGNSVVVNYYSHNKIINKTINAVPQEFKVDNLKEYNYTLIKPDTLVSANSKITRTYFIEPYNSIQNARELLGDETLTSNEEWIITLPAEKILSYLKSKIMLNYAQFKETKIERVNSLSNTFIKTDFNDNTYILMKDKYENQTYFIPYEVSYEDNKNLEWADLVLQPTTLKTRLVTGNKSNRYNLLQSVAEKFKVYIDSIVVHDPDSGKLIYKNGQPIKLMFFTDRIGKKTYNGVLEKVNLNSINRTINSTELITKMYVENIETEYNDDGYVTIQLADKNPSKENYIYNFKHYLNSGQLTPLFTQELNQHNNALKAINIKYLNNTTKLTNLKEEYSKIKSYVKSLEESKVAAQDKLEEILEELCNIIEGTYVYNGSGGHINSEIFKQYDLNGNLLKQNKQLNYTFMVNESIFIDDVEYVLIGDYDWIEAWRTNPVYDLTHNLQISQKTVIDNIKNIIQEYIDKTETDNGFVYSDDMNQTIYYRNNGKELRCVVNYFYIPYKNVPNKGINASFENNIKNNKNWNLDSTKEFTFAPKFLAAATAKAKITAFNEMKVEINSITKKLTGAQEEADKIQEQIKELTLVVERELKAKSSIINSFENKYIQFIKEGYWSQSNYSDNNSYYLDALCVSNENSLPKVEYSIDIIDLSGLKGYEDFTYNLGDETFIIDEDIFGKDETGKPIEERIVITEIDIQLDNNSNNKISLKNYTSRFEDLFSKISASVTTVQSNEYQWDKASVLNSNGTIPSELLTSINTNNNALASNSIGLLNNYSLDENGLTLVSQVDNNYQLKATALGIFFTQTALKNRQWTLGISAEGINANAINVGTINTNKITLMSDYAPSQVWDSLGLTMYAATGIDKNLFIDKNKFVRLDKHGLYYIKNSGSFQLDSNGQPWFYGLSYEDSLREVIKKANVSITKNGFIYNSNPEAENTYIKIGYLDDLEGIEAKKDGEIYFSVKSDNTATIAGWNFNANSFWKGLDSNLVNTNKALDEAFLQKGSFVIKPDNGLAMQNIKLDATNGLAKFGNIYLTGGEIKGANLRISQAMLGPFRFDCTYSGNYATQGYMYGKVYGNKMTVNWNDLAKEKISGRHSDAKGTVRAIVTQDHDFYLGTATLTKRDLSDTMDSFAQEAINHLSKDTMGVLLSLGDDFWIHSAGYGRISGNILMSGKVHIKELAVDSFSVKGKTFESYLEPNRVKIVEVVNQAISNEEINLGGYNKDKTVSVQMSITPTNFRAYNYTLQKTLDFSKMPCITFSSKDQVGYLIPYSGALVANVLQLFFVTLNKNGDWVAQLLVGG